MIDWEDLTAADFLEGGRFLRGLQREVRPELPGPYASFGKGIRYPDGTDRKWYPDPKYPDSPAPWTSGWPKYAGLSGC